MNNKIVKGAFGLFAFGLLTMSAMPGYSTTIPAMAGHAWVASGATGTTYAADQACFVSAWSQVSNACSTTKKLLIPVSSTANGSVTFKTNNPPASGGICLFAASCRAIVNSSVNGLLTQTAAVAGCGTQTLGTLSVGANDVVHYDCDVPANGKLLSVQF